MLRSSQRKSTPIRYFFRAQPPVVLRDNEDKAGTPPRAAEVERSGRDDVRRTSPKERTANARLNAHMKCRGDGPVMCGSPQPMTR